MSSLRLKQRFAPALRSLSLGVLGLAVAVGCGDEQSPPGEGISGAPSAGGGTLPIAGGGTLPIAGGGAGGAVAGSSPSAGSSGANGGGGGAAAGAGAVAGAGGVLGGGGNGGAAGAAFAGAGGVGGAGAGGTAGAPSGARKFVGNITTGYNGSLDSGGRIFSTYWDQVTPENAGKWGSVQRDASSAFNWGTLDAIYDYTQKKGIIFKQHVFVWGSQQPTGQLSETHVKAWMNAFCKRYPNTRLIDVVNEPPPHTTPSYADAIGGGTNGNWQWIVNSFKWARAACPNAILIINDYNNIEYGDQNQNFIDIVKKAKAAGAPIDAVGAQAHGLSTNVSTATMKSLVTKLHNDTGLPVYITEYDIDLADDSAQLERYKQHLPFFLETEWIHGVTIWGWIYGSTWVPSSGLIKNGTPRPAMNWLMQQLNRPTP